MYNADVAVLHRLKITFTLVRSHLLLINYDGKYVLRVRIYFPQQTHLNIRVKRVLAGKGGTGWGKITNIRVHTGSGCSPRHFWSTVNIHFKLETRL